MFSSCRSKKEKRKNTNRCLSSEQKTNSDAFLLCTDVISIFFSLHLVSRFPACSSYGPLGAEQEEEDVSRSRWACFFFFDLSALQLLSPVLRSLRPPSFSRALLTVYGLDTKHSSTISAYREKTAAPDSGGSLAGLAMVAAAAAALVWWRRRTNAPGSSGASASKGKQVRPLRCERR